MTVKIALVTDFHYGFPESEEMEGYADPVLREIVSDINSFSPDFVVGLGDFIQHSDAETDIDRLRNISEIFSGLETDFYAVPGNHDIVSIDKQQFIESLGPENGSTYFDFEMGGNRFIFLDTTHRNPDLDSVGGLMGRDQREWLRGRLNQKRTFVFSHHLLHYRNLEDNWWFYDKPELAAAMDKRAFNDMIQPETVGGVVSAHVHSPGRVDFNGVPHFTMASMDKYSPPERLQANVARMVIDENSFSLKSEHQSYEVGR